MSVRITYTCDGCGKEKTTPVGAGTGRPQGWGDVNIRAWGFNASPYAPPLSDIGISRDLCTDCQLQLVDGIDPKNWPRPQK